MTERNMSCFFVKELMPLYIENKIDAKRRVEVKEHLEICPDCNSYFERLKLAREALNELSKTKVSPETIAYLKEEHTFWTDFYRKLNWSKWPNSLKWGAELALVTTVLAVTIHVFPWIKFARSIKSLQPDAPVIVAKKIEVPTPVASPVATETPVEKVAINTISNITPAAPPPPPPAPVVKAPPQEPEQQTAEEQNDDSEENTAGAATKKQMGFVWRGSLQVDELTDELTDRVTATITELGGTKAGEVELGWHRGNQRYYHFILPEDNYEKLLSVLNSEGLADIKEFRHQKVMKPGYMRIIMTVKESPQ